MWRRLAAWLYSAAGGFFVCFPDFLLDFDITGRGCVCVYICEVLFLLRLFIFPLLAVSVVVCPIIYLFCWCGLCIG